MRHMNYKPGWWALYFLYLAIPAGCYVYYLYRRSKEVDLQFYTFFYRLKLLLIRVIAKHIIVY